MRHKDTDSLQVGDVVEVTKTFGDRHFMFETGDKGIITEIVDFNSISQKPIQVFWGITMLNQPGHMEWLVRERIINNFKIL